MGAILYTVLGLLSGLRDALSAAGRYLTANPTRIAFALLTALCAFLSWRLSTVDASRDAWRTKAQGYEAAAKALVEANAAASAAGIAAAGQTKKDIDDGNERARAAAAGSDDPLGSAFGELRKGR
ncbi:hypothetical protein [Sphingopyxis sp. PET50]|uniref:hypothetical protein n=1 Tax=Sphingopyxis sp. PET50 TaxID=2976533 RepID=UPI0021AE82C7|nr:hypothetical protein [Sphingopyxis sp. PET50]